MSTIEAPRLATLPHEVVPAKIRIPVPRPGSVHRTALVNRLRVTRSYALVTVVAPAGYGKTTLLAQWAGRDARPFVWVSIDEGDNDAATLLRHLGLALDMSQSPAPTVPGVAGAVAALETPSVVVLDNASRISSRDALKVVATVAEHMPSGSTLVLAGREPPRLPLARLRAEGRLHEIGPELLALSHREGTLLLEAEGIALPADRLEDVLARAEGWPAGLYLAALACRDGCPPSEIGGDDRYLAEYLRSEYLSHLEPDRLAFLRQASVLERMSGPLCDAVLGRSDSSLQLEALARRNLFLVPLDRRGERYRFHGLFRGLLRRELQEREPRRVSLLNRRAAAWCEKHGLPDEAVRYASTAGDLDRIARLLRSATPSSPDRGLAAFDDKQLRRYPDIALLGAWIEALHGRSHEAERRLATAERADVGPEGAVIRAALCSKGIDRMAADAATAVRAIPADSSWHALALLVAGAARMLQGDLEQAEEFLSEATDAAESPAVRAAALAERALLAAARGDHGAAESLALAARSAGRGPTNATHALALAVSARALLRSGRWSEARAELAAAEELAPLLTHALPWLTVQTLLELTRAHVTLRDAEAASGLLAHATGILRRRPRLGALVTEAETLSGDVEDLLAARLGKESGLTTAELRLLPLLSTHLTFREIGARFLVSRNTVKTQAISVYRKLGVSSRSEAIAAAARLGLVAVSSGADDAVA